MGVFKPPGGLKKQISSTYREQRLRMLLRIPERAQTMFEAVLGHPRTTLNDVRRSRMLQKVLEKSFEVFEAALEYPPTFLNAVFARLNFRMLYFLALGTVACERTSFRPQPSSIKCPAASSNVLKQRSMLQSILKRPRTMFEDALEAFLNVVRGCSEHPFLEHPFIITLSPPSPTFVK